MALLLATFFLASAGASAAYLTVSEIFPMETRALAIAFFYAIGTAIGGITGPLLFAKLIESGKESQVAIGFYLGAAVMAIGGVVEIFFGVKAEQRDLEDIATPLTAEEAEGEPSAEDEPRDGAEKESVAPDRPREAVAASARERTRLRARFGPGSISSSPGMYVSTPIPAVPLAREVGRIERALAEHGTTDRATLSRYVGARSWGPGRYGAALREAVASGRARRVGRSSFAPTRTERDGPR
jgi:MFS family permease